MVLGADAVVSHGGDEQRRELRLAARHDAGEQPGPVAAETAERELRFRAVASAGEAIVQREVAGAW